MQIYLIRHGETEWNLERRYQGSQDISLSQAGREQLRPARLRPERVYVSRMKRARETAELLFPGVPQVVVPDLQEMNFGVFEGRNYIEMEHDPEYRAWVDGNCEGRCPGGESQEEFTDRTVRAVSGLLTACRERGEDPVVIVAHGGTEMSLLSRCGRPEKPYYSWLTGNGKGYLLDDADWWDQGILRVTEKIDLTKKG